MPKINGDNMLSCRKNDGLRIIHCLALVLVLFFSQAWAVEVSFHNVKPAVIIDVRTPEEYAAGHITGAVNIPYEQIASGITQVKGLKKDSPILVYCRSGRRSGIAKATLEQQGYKQVLDGGAMDALSKSLQPCTPQHC